LEITNFGGEFQPFILISQSNLLKTTLDFAVGVVLFVVLSFVVVIVVVVMEKCYVVFGIVVFVIVG